MVWQIKPTRVKTATEVATTRVGLHTERYVGQFRKGLSRTYVAIFAT